MALIEGVSTGDEIVNELKTYSEQYGYHIDDEQERVLRKKKEGEAKRWGIVAFIILLISLLYIFVIKIVETK